MIQRFKEVDAMLRSLIDTEPRAAIQVARELEPDGLLDRDNLDGLRAGTLVDAGFETQDMDAVAEGVRLFEALLERCPERPDVEYSLANGLWSYSALEALGRSDWYFILAASLRRARCLYQRAGSNTSAARSLRAQALTNLANSLLRVYRTVEAYDFYARAIELDPTNGIALTGAARALIHLAERSIGEREPLLTVAARHLAAARENPDRIRELAGARALRRLSKLLQTELPLVTPTIPANATDYQRFVQKHRLALSAAIDSPHFPLQRWDSLRLGSIMTRADDGSGVPPIFAMFNVLKSEYLCSRYLAFSALEEPFPESGKYLDTLDYAVYGVRQSTQTLAQRSCLDLLDKVAVATCEYLELKRGATSINFRNSWFEDVKDTGRLRWQPAITDAIEQGVTALVAISDVARDVSAGGFLQEKVSMRNSSTHRFLVLHDLGCEPSRKSEYVDHLPLAVLDEQIIETLRLARAVLFYFVEMVMQAEHRHHGEGGFIPSLFIPDHDWVRGEDDSLS